MKTAWLVAQLLLPTAALIFYIAASVSILPRMPERVAVHFNLQGVPNDWMPARPWIVMSICVLAVEYLVLGGGLLIMSHVRPLATAVPFAAIVAFCFGLTLTAFLQVNRINLTEQRTIRPIYLLGVGATFLAMSLLESHFFGLIG